MKRKSARRGSNRRRSYTASSNRSTWDRKGRKNRASYLYLIPMVLLVVGFLLITVSLRFLSMPSLEKKYEPNPLPLSIGDFTKVASNTYLPDGKVPVMFIGSQACPYCAAESWSIYLALESFGTFGSLSYLYSNASDSYPDTPGIDFMNATYQSSSVAFFCYYTTNRNWQPLQPLNATDQALMSKYDSTGHIPFILIGNVYLRIGASYSPSILSHLTGSQVMSMLESGGVLQTTGEIVNESATVKQVVGDVMTHGPQPIASFARLLIMRSTIVT